MDAPDLTVERCTITFAETADLAADDLLGAAIFLRGDCRGFRALDNTFGSTLAPTYTAITTTTIQGNFPLRERIGALATAAATADPAAVTGSTTASPAAAQPRLRLPPPRPQQQQLKSRRPARLDIDVNVLNGRNLVSVLTNRAAATFAQQRTPMRATVGLLGLPMMKSTNQSEAIVILNNSIACALGDAVIRGNGMNDLTFGTLLVAGFASLRIQDNNLTGGVAGFWVVLPGARNPDDVQARASSSTPSRTSRSSIS